MATDLYAGMYESLELSLKPEELAFLNAVSECDIGQVSHYLREGGNINLNIDEKEFSILRWAIDSDCSGTKKLGMIKELISKGAYTESGYRMFDDGDIPGWTEEFAEMTPFQSAIQLSDRKTAMEIILLIGTAHKLIKEREDKEKEFIKKATKIVKEKKEKKEKMMKTLKTALLHPYNEAKKSSSGAAASGKHKKKTQTKRRKPKKSTKKHKGKKRKQTKHRKRR